LSYPIRHGQVLNWTFSTIFQSIKLDLLYVREVKETFLLVYGQSYYFGI
jgi:hypothetical protein